jgi:hypothetical protein
MDQYSAADFAVDLAVLDAPIQRVVQFLRFNAEQSESQHSTVVALLQDIKTDTHFSAQTAAVSLISSAPGSALPSGSNRPPLPAVIHALGSPHHSPLLSSMSSTDHTTTTGSTPSGDARYLQCPFCPHKHYNEKVHVQHLHRVLVR